MPDVHLNDHQTLPTIIGPFRFVFEFSVFVVRFCGSWPPTLPCKRTDQRHCPSRGTLPIKLEETCLKRGGGGERHPDPGKKRYGRPSFFIFFSSRHQVPKRSIWARESRISWSQVAILLLWPILTIFSGGPKCRLWRSLGYLRGPESWYKQNELPLTYRSLSLTVPELWGLKDAKICTKEWVNLIFPIRKGQFRSIWARESRISWSQVAILLLWPLFGQPKT